MTSDTGQTLSILPLCHFGLHQKYSTATPTDTQTNVNSGPVTTATVPYIRGTSETIARILQPYNIRVAHKPITTLRRLLTNVKDKDKPKDRQDQMLIKCIQDQMLQLPGFLHW